MLAQGVAARGSRILISIPFSGPSRICAGSFVLLSLPRFLTHTLCLYFSEQVSSHQTTRPISSGQQRTTFDTKQIEPLLEEAKTKQGGSLPDVEAGEAYHHWSHSPSMNLHP